MQFAAQERTLNVDLQRLTEARQLSLDGGSQRAQRHAHVHNGTRMCTMHTVLQIILVQRPAF
jgi:hypothetical protein